MGSKAIRCFAKYALCFFCVGADVGEDICPYFKNAGHEGYWLIVCRVGKVVFVRFVDKFCRAGAPFLSRSCVWP